MEKEKTIDVTIIVPVYNVEKYLKKCLDSLVNQTYDKNKYEIYIINDASKDNSLNIIKEYQKKYSNITLYDLKNNKGVSHARNIGIKNAKGKYLLFCDSDDYYELDAIEKLITYAKNNDSDFVMANYYIAKDNNNIKVNTTNYFKKEVISKEESICYMTLTSCSKLIKKDLFIKNNVFYPEDLKHCEELTVIPVLSYLAKKPTTMNEYLYYYYQRQGSASNSHEKTNIKDLFFFDETYNRFIKCLNKDKYQEEIEFRAIDHLLYGKTLVMLKSHISRKEIIKHINNFNNTFPNALKNKYLKEHSFAKKIFIILTRKKIIFGIKILAIIHKLLTR